MSKFDKLSDIGEVIDSLHKTPKYSDVGRAMVRCTDVKYGRLDLTNTFKVSEEVFAEFSRRYTPKKDDIIITRVGSYGITALVEDDDFCLGQNTSVIVPKAIDPRYLYLALNSFIVKNQIEFSVVGSTQKTLSLKAINNLDIPRFDIEVEKKIAKIVGQLDDKIELNRQNNQTLEHIAQALFKCWFVDFEPTRAKIIAKEKSANTAIQELAAQAIICGAMTLEQLEVITQNLETRLQQAINEKLNQANQTPINTEQLKTTAALFPNALVESDGVTNSSGTNLHERSEPEGGGSGTSRLIPEGWEVGKLKNIAEFFTDRIATAGLTIENYISTENMLEGKKGITKASSLPAVKTVPSFKPGQILISNIRPYFMKIWLARFEGGRSGDVLGLEAKEAESIEYLYNLLYQDVFFNFMMTTSKGAKMPRGDKDAIMGWPCVLPSLGVKKAYSGTISRFYEIIESNNDENINLEKTRDALLPKLLSGELSVSSD